MTRKCSSTRDWEKTQFTISRLARITTIAVVWLGAGLHVAQAQITPSKTEADLRLYAVDENGYLVENLVAGKYVALIVEANTGVFPDKVAAGLSARAEFSTQVFGQLVKYSISLPVAKASASSRLDPTVGTPTSGLKIGNDLQNRIWSERFDFYIPSEAPAGTVTITIRANGTSAKSVYRAFTFKVIR